MGLFDGGGESAADMCNSDKINYEWACGTCGADIGPMDPSCGSCGESIEWDGEPIY